MAANIAIPAFGAKLQRGDGGSPEVFTTFADQVEVSAPVYERDLVEVTHAESPSNWQEFIKGSVKRLQAFTVKISYKPTETTHNATTGLLADCNAETARNYRFVQPEATYIAFAALVKSFAPGTSDQKGQLTATVTFQPTGAVTFSA